MRKTITAIAVASLLSYTSFLSAQEHSSDNVETMVVTANRTYQPVRSVLASVDVVDREDIELTKAKSLLDVLRYLPGIQFSQSGGRGQSTSVYIRGAESAHTLVLLDGVKVNSATSGGFDFSEIPAAVIEKVEVIRGPRAAIYGADAIGGVINVITTPDSYETKHTLTAGIGGNGYYQGAWRSVGQLNDTTQGQLTLNKEYSDGYNIKEGTSDDSSKEYGYESKDLVASLTHKIDENFEGKLSAVYSDGYSQYDKSVHNHYQSDLESYRVSGQVNYMSDIYYSQLIYSKYKNDGLEHPSDSFSNHSQYITRRDIATWLNTLMVSDDIVVTAGFDFDEEKVSSTTDYDEKSRENKAGFVTSSAEYNVFTLEASIRYDDNESYGDHTTWSTALGWDMNESLSAHVSHGTGFKAPTFNDLYYPGFGNPDLEAQESESSEIGISGYHEFLTWRLSAFISEVENMITYYESTTENVDANIKGIEMDMQFDTGAITHDLQVSLLDPKDSKGYQLARRAKQTASWKATYYADKWNTTLATRYQSKTYSDTNNTEELPSNIVFDLISNVDLSEKWTVSGKVVNLFDKEYSLVDGYVAQGRTWYLESKYSF